VVDKKRIDVLLVEKGLCESREKAKALIMAGKVFIGTERCDKSGMTVLENSDLQLKGSLKYVSRGGLKLEKAITSFFIDLTDNICMDIGSSTGGFTDCMLQNGAKKVFAVDVSMERTNIRYVTKEKIGTMLDFASIDVSFISLTLVLPVLSSLLNENGEALCLVKPQFEAGREKVGKKGVVREVKTHIEVCEKIYNFLPSCGFSLMGATFSPIKGPEGNIEYLFHIKKVDQQNKISLEELTRMVEESHESLKTKQN